MRRSQQKQKIKIRRIPASPLEDHFLRMDKILQRFLLVPPSVQTADLLESTVKQVRQRVWYVIQQIDQHRLSLLSSSSYSTSTTLMDVENNLGNAEHWCDVGGAEERSIEEFIRYLQSLLQQQLLVDAAIPGGSPSLSTASSPLARDKSSGKAEPIPPPVLHRSRTLLKRYKAELSGALVKASLLILQEKNNGVLSSMAVGSGDGSNGGMKHTRNKRQASLSNQEALRSLIRTKAAVSQELQKVESAFHEIKKDTQSMEALHEALQEVNDSMGKAKKITKRLELVEFVDKILLYISFLVFFLTIAYIFLQRIFGFFPIIVR